MADRRVINVVLGSTSDNNKIIPSLVAVTRQLPVDVQVHYASADNTPDKLKRLIEGGRLFNQKGDVTKGARCWISGAGVSNVLTGVIKAQSDYRDLNIGIPISDSSSLGLTSLLSTAEKPTRNPVLVVGINNSYAAVNIAYRFLEGLSMGVAILETEQHVELTKRAEKFGLPFSVKSIADLVPYEVVLNTFHGHQSSLLELVDSRLEGGVQVGVSSMQIHSYFGEYCRVLDGTKATGLVSSLSYDNAIQIAAILTRNYDVVKKIIESGADKVRTLEEHEGLLIFSGEIRGEV